MKTREIKQCQDTAENIGDCIKKLGINSGERGLAKRKTFRNENRYEADMHKN